MRPFCSTLVFGLGLALVIPAHRAASQPFTFTLVESNLTPLNYAALSFADVDRDGDLDLVATGNAAVMPPFLPTASVVLNQGPGHAAPGGGVPGERHRFEEQPLAPALWHSAVAWADYDRDGAPDFVLTGTTRQEPPFDAVTRLYRNRGDGAFEVVEAGLLGLYGGDAAWGDYDGDGDEDLLLNGVTATGAYATKLYRNDGGGTFTDVPVGLPPTAFGALDWGDYDGDGDLDVLLSGAEPAGAFTTRLYRNDDGGTFTEVEAGLAGLVFSTAAWGDYDNDGDLDVLLCGGRLGPRLLEGVAKVYRNDEGRFANLGVDLPGVVYGTAAWGDYDSDGDLDVLITGAQELGGARVTRVYQNRGQDAFVHRINLLAVSVASASWGDYDDDHDLDLFVMGVSSDGRPLTHLYRSDQYKVNALPAPPGGLSAAVDGSTVTLAWDAGSDAETPAAGLSYNLRVGTHPEGGDVVSPLADARSGYRYVSARGNAGPGTRRVLKNLPRGHYYWSVQAIDHSFKGSPFAEEGTFTVEVEGAAATASEQEAGLPRRFGLLPSYPNPFHEATTLVYDMPAPAFVELKVYDVLGKAVRIVVRGEQAAGRHEAVWDGRDGAGRRVGAGLYFVQLRVAARSWSTKLLLLD